MKKISDFTLNLFLKKYHETREKLWKLQDCVTKVYLVDDVDDNYSRLSKRRQPIQVYNHDFVIAYTTVILSNFINNNDDLIIWPSAGEAETQNILFENIFKFMQTAKKTRRTKYVLLTETWVQWNEILFSMECFFQTNYIYIYI